MDEFDCHIFTGLNAPPDGPGNGLRWIEQPATPTSPRRLTPGLGEQIKATFPLARVFYWGHDETPGIDPKRALIFIGHSYGGDAALLWSQVLTGACRSRKGISYTPETRIYLTLGLDPVPDAAKQRGAGDFKGPSIIPNVVCYIRDTPLPLRIPFSYPFVGAHVVTLGVPGGHNDVPANPLIHARIIANLKTNLSATLPEDAWLLHNPQP